MNFRKRARFKLARLVSEFRRVKVTRAGRVMVDRRGFRMGGDCSIEAVGPGTITIGEAVHLAERVCLLSEGRLVIGAWSYINRDAMIVALGEITIGEGCRIAERVSIRDHDHRFSDPSLPVMSQGYEIAPIHIGRNCWIGCNAVILKGVTLGDGSVVGAGAVVTKDVPARCLVGGVPARVIRTLPASDSPSIPAGNPVNQK